jgi:hypothetical protein
MPAAVAVMPKKNPRSSTGDQGVRISADVAQMARVVASVEGGTISKLISEICRPVLTKRVQALMDAGRLIPPPPERD